MVKEIYTYKGGVFRHTVIIKGQKYTIQEHLEPDELYKFLKSHVADELIKNGKVVFD